MFNPHLTLNCAGRLLSLEAPIIMGILNLTPDSFYDGGKHQDLSNILLQVEKMLREGAAIIDIGAISTRPGADVHSADIELKRMRPVLKAILKSFPDCTISIDTFRAEVARICVEEGAAMINDISGGTMDDQMFRTVANMREIPYVLMHIQGTPATMQQAPYYEDVAQVVLDYFIDKADQLVDLGMKDVIIDPGFGFGKTIDHNYELLQKLHIFKMLDWPILAGLSRKSMIYKTLETTAAEALNGTSVLNFEALRQGAKILRVHDVAPAMETIKLFLELDKYRPKSELIE